MSDKNWLINEELELLTKQQKYLTVKHNFLVEARFSLSVLEQKVIAFAISRLHKFTPKPEGKEEGIKVSFTIPEYCKVMDIDPRQGDNYRLVKEAARSVRNKSVWVNDNLGEVTVSWFQRVKANKNSGTVTVEFDYHLTPFLLGLDNNFTSYEVFQIANMKSRYSVRMYEYMKLLSWKDQPVTVAIDLLKKMFKAEHFERYADFRRKVLEKAVKEINDNTDLRVKWKPTSKRNIKEIEFTIDVPESINPDDKNIIAVDHDPNQASLFD